MMGGRINIAVLVFFFCSCGTAKNAYVFTSFREPADEGLRFLVSDDGYKWKETGKIWMRPKAGSQKILRDPSMVKGPDGSFHLVWTTAWRGDKGFGYASSKDLVHWSEQRFIPVMEHEQETVNVWAPEIMYDEERKEFVIIWASTIPFRFKKGIEEENNNHRMYYTTTKDFVSFSKAALLLDPGFSVIDAVVVNRALQDYVMVLKDNTRPNRNLKTAFGKNILGPFTEISAPFSEYLSEGPTVVKIGKEWLIYYDSYGKKKYGALATEDFKIFRDVNERVEIPEGHKHGTIVRVPKKTVRNLKRKAIGK